MVLALSCSGIRATAQPASAVPGNFVETTTASGIKFKDVASHTSKKYLLETMGSGVGVFDFDNDGLLDVFLVNGTPLADPTPKGTIPQKKTTGTVSTIRRRMAPSKT